MIKSRSVAVCFFLVVVAVLATCSAQYIGTPIDCPANEFYTNCGGSCQTECATLGKPCLIRHIRCPDGCYCNEGYARDSTGRCIPVAQCPK